MQGREAELIGASSGFAVDSSYSSSSAWLGTVSRMGVWEGQGRPLCGHWGCQTRGCGGVISLVPIPQPCPGVPGVSSLQRAPAPVQEQLLAIPTLWQHCWRVLLKQSLRGKAQAL